MINKGTVRLETDRLVLRRFVAEDAGCMFRNWASDEEVTRYLTWPAHENTGVTAYVLNDWIPRYENSDYYNWAIELKETGEAVGNISVVELNESIEEASVGYCLGRKYWGQGIMPEALGEVIAFLFDEVQLNRVQAGHDVNNPKSGRVMEKAGMKYEGTFRQHGLNNRGIVDVACYGVLKDEV